MTVQGYPTSVILVRKFTYIYIYGVVYAKHTHTHPFNGPLSGTTRVSQYQRGKTNLDFTRARDSVAVASAETYASFHLAPDR